MKQKFFVETRSLNDARYGKGTEVGKNAYVDTHYRRFMSTEDLSQAASAAGLSVLDVLETSPGSGTDGARVIRATISTA